MKFYKFLRIVASVFLVSVVLVACSDDGSGNSSGGGGGNGNDGGGTTPTTPQVNNKCSADGSGTAVNLFFGDATYTNCTTTTIASDGYFSFAANASEINHTVETSGGADSTTGAYRLALTGGTSAWGGGGITLGASKNATFDAAGKSLSLWLKSAQATTVNVEFEGVGADPAGAKSAQRTITGITDAWKQFSIPIGDFDLQTLAANAINKIIFIFNDVNGDTAGIGAQTIDIDEVRFVADGGTATPVSNVFVVYGDADYSALSSVNNVTTTTSYRAEVGAIPADSITDVEVDGGANSSAKSRDLSLTAAGANYAITIAELASAANLSSYNTLKIDFKSPVSGGVGRIEVKIEGDTGAKHTTPVEKAFPNNGTWQTVSWTLADLVKNGGFTFNSVNKVVLILSDADGASIGGVDAQNFSWDEVRFETVNLPSDSTAPIVSNASAIVTARTANVSIDVNEVGKLFWVVYADGTAAPANAVALIAAAGLPPSGTTIANSGNAGRAVFAGAAMVAISRLTASTNYDFYAVAQDAAGNNSALSARLDITTAAPAAASDVFVVYGDANYSALGSVTNVTTTNTYGKDAEGGADRITDAEVSGGANSSAKSRDASLTVAAAGWAVVFPELASAADLSSYNTLKIDFKSPASGGVRAIKVKIEGAGKATNEVEKKPLTNDGNWQTVSWALADFTKNGVEFNEVNKVTIVLSDANGATAGIGVQAFSWDEVRFETVVDTTAPTVSNARTTATTATSVTVSIDVNETGKLFWVAYTTGTAAPADATALIAAAGVTPSGTTVANSGSAGQAVSAGTAMVSVAGLSAITDYDFYAVAQDTAGNTSALSDKLDITVVDTTAPTVSNARTTATTATSVTVSIDVNEAGKLFWVAYTDGTAAPADAAALIVAAGVTPSGTTIANSSSAGQAVAVGTVTVSVTGLTDGTDYDFYAVTQDAAGNNSALSAKLDISAVAAPDVFVIYGDADYSALGRVENVTSTTAFGKDADGGAANITDVEVGAAGAKSRDVGVTVAGTGWAVVFPDLAVTSDLSSYNTLKIDFKSPVSGGVGRIEVKIEGVASAKHTTPVEKTFTNDGTWQTVSWVFADLVKNGGFNFDSVDKVVLILSDANGATAGIGAQTFSWDEVRFE